ncbi:MAG: hypothetical protein ACFFD2_06315 [Promethearchaeota archaeon]
MCELLQNSFEPKKKQFVKEQYVYINRKKINYILIDGKIHPQEVKLNWYLNSDTSIEGKDGLFCEYYSAKLLYKIDIKILKNK